MITKILIANRGEIACRIIKTAKALGIKTVAVYSEADSHALFTEQADEAYYIGESEPSESYLKIDKIINIAKTSGADAIHPGYGFLSENPELPALCKENRIIFIGPPASAIHAMGSKSEAKNIMLKVQVPLVPGYHGENQSIEVLKKASLEVGFPQLIKASAGGGGKGMRIVRQKEDVEHAILAAQREALSSFGDSKLLIEKYIEQPRHIEVQIFCDEQGNGVYLYDRDCSVQRRHQKIIEEAPAPGLSDKTRQIMGETALNCAKAINYVGAGTVEFLLDKNQKFYFMEMNTRLQVEHPVSEMITGQDLVEWQIKVANGEPLPLAQSEIPCIGHAFESRIYAENPDKDFLPATGKLQHLSLPEESEVVRIDSGIRTNDEISVFYDPMIAKLITWGEDRAIAAQTMHRALSEIHIAGIDTNCDFLKSVISHPEFLNEQITTEFIETHKVDLFNKPTPDKSTILTAAALYIHSIIADKTTNKTQTTDPFSPWNNTDFWQLNGTQATTFSLIQQDIKHTFEVSSNHNEGYVITYNNDEYEVHFVLQNNKINTLINGVKTSSSFFLNNKLIKLFKVSSSYDFELPNIIHDSDEAQPEGSLLAPLHGKIISLEVDSGAHVNKGDPLIIIEAMKMEHTIFAPSSGIVKNYYCTQNEIVNADQQLIEFIPEELQE